MPEPIEKVPWARIASNTTLQTTSRVFHQQKIEPFRCSRAVADPKVLCKYLFKIMAGFVIVSSQRTGGIPGFRIAFDYEGAGSWLNL